AAPSRSRRRCADISSPRRIIVPGNEALTRPTVCRETPPNVEGRLAELKPDGELLGAGPGSTNREPGKARPIGSCDLLHLDQPHALQVDFSIFTDQIRARSPAGSSFQRSRRRSARSPASEAAHLVSG